MVVHINGYFWATITMIYKYTYMYVCESWEHGICDGDCCRLDETRKFVWHNQPMIWEVTLLKR